MRGDGTKSRRREGVLNYWEVAAAGVAVVQSLGLKGRRGRRGEGGGCY